MSNKRNTAMQDYYLISRIAHVIERSALAMAGAMCGTFVAAQMTKTHVAMFNSVGFIASMVLAGVIQLCLGNRYPTAAGNDRQRAAESRSGRIAQRHRHIP